MKRNLFIVVLFIFIPSILLAQDFQFTALEGHTEYISDLVFSPDGKILASSSRDRTIRLWNVDSGTELHKLTGHNTYIYSIAFSPDGSTLASGSENGKIRLWDVNTGQYRVTLEGHRNAVRGIAFSPDGQTLASGSSDYTIRLWNAMTGLYRVTLEGHTNTVNSIVFSPDGKTIVSGSSDRLVRMWNASTGFHLRTLTGHNDEVYEVSFIEDGQTITSRDRHGTIRFWDSITGQPKESPVISNLIHATINSNGTMIAGVYSNRKISLWDIATEISIALLEGHTSSINSLMFSPDGEILASGGDDRIIRLWDLSTSVVISPVTIEVPPVDNEFDVNVDIMGGTDVRGFKIIVEFDKESLLYVSHTLGDYLSDELFVGPTTNQPGQVSFISISTKDSGSGDGTLASIKFRVLKRRASTLSLSALLSDSDGNRLPYIAISAKVVEPPWDVNGDGSVDILDLAYVGARFGKEDQHVADINKDGVVDIKDLITIASGLSEHANAPTILPARLNGLPTHSTIELWLTQALQINIKDDSFQQGIEFLYQLLISLIPEETALLPNYPNPFNPETWIPYQLAKTSEVTIEIYTTDGMIVRTLNLGNISTGVYQTPDRAAYWNGKNSLGESVASGIYFYTLTAGDFTATRKMLILK